MVPYMVCEQYEVLQENVAMHFRAACEVKCPPLVDEVAVWLGTCNYVFTS